MLRSTPLAIIASIALCGPALAAGETITVTTLNDSFDIATSPGMGDLPGPGGSVSFREAVAVVNAMPGPQTIAFAIPRSEWWLLDDVALLRLEDGLFLLSDDGTTVDFSTQTDFTGDTNPDGGEVGIYGLQPNGWGITAILISGDDCVIRGLGRVMQRGYGVEIRGHNNRVIGSSISGSLYSGVRVTGPSPGVPATGNIIGGTEPGDGNTLSGGNSGVRIDGPAQNNIVIGNTLSGSYAGIEVRGAPCCEGYTPFDTRIGGPTPAERNVIADAGHYGEEGFPDGAQVSIEYAVDTTVEGNYIGTNADGTASAGQIGPAGVRVFNTDGTIVRGNLISGIEVTGVNHYDGDRFGVAVGVTGDCDGTVVQNNTIGTDVTGQNPILNVAGVTVGLWPGSPAPASTLIDGNLVANSESDGIRVSTGVTGVRITGNEVRDNGDLGIDLGGNGVSPNDAGDGDTGANNLQNFPVLDGASSSGSSITVSGTLESLPNRSYRIELFASPACDPSGFGEAATFLGGTVVTTDGAGEASFETALAASVPAGHVATATATDETTGDTSELSACQPVDGDDGGIAGDADDNGAVNVDDLVMVITHWGECPGQGPGCAGDVTADGWVNVDDIVAVIVNWS